MPRTFFSLSISLILLVAGSLNLSGQSPEGPSLPELVSPEAGLVLRAQNLKGNVSTLLNSPWVEKFLRSPLGVEFSNSNDVQKIVRAGRQIEELTGGPLLDYLNQIFGEDLIVALVPGEEGQNPYGLLVTAADSELVLQQAVARWKRLEAQTTVTFRHNGLEYTCRTPIRKNNADGDRLYYAVLGRIFVLSHDEQAVRRTLDLYQSARSSDKAALLPSLAGSTEYNSAREHLPSPYWISVYFSPSRWKRAFAGLRETSDSDPALKVLARFLKHSRSLILGLRFEDGLLARLHVDSDGVARDFLHPFIASPSGATEPPSLPTPCIAFVRLQLPGAMLSPLIAPLLERHVSQWAHLQPILSGIFLGHDPLTEVLPQVGPVWQFSLHPLPQNAGERPLHFDFLTSVNYQAVELTNPSGIKSTMQAALANGIHSLLHLIALGESEKNRAVEVLRQSDQTRTQWKIRRQTHAVAELVLDETSILATSNPQLIAPDPNSDGQLRSSPHWQNSIPRHVPNAPHTLWVHLPSLLQALPNHEPDRNFRQVLELFDVAWLSLQVEQDLLRFDAGLQSFPASQP